ncbi:hypothetical protein ONZ45_g2194 [Pleurotus djamor]|nr:hypothetical protein ONZ45_g2194 [Pleurotus djamor]
MTEDEIPLLSDPEHREEITQPSQSRGQEPTAISETVPIPGGEEPPPAFTPYEAEFFETSDGNIVSHDPHLNYDGEALYRFLLFHAQTPPSYLLKCKGTHEERRTRFVSYDDHGETKTRIEYYTDTVTDFDFSIDIGQHIVPAPVVSWSVADHEPAYRGDMILEVDEGLNGRRSASSEEESSYEKWDKIRRRSGLPPWATEYQREDGTSNGNGTTVLRSSRTLREWADEYCQSQKLLKEFVYEKVLYGWNIEELERAIQDAIVLTPYDGRTSVEFETKKSKIYIRPDNSLSRILSKWWIRVLLWITLIYPFIWLFKRLHPLGGGKWQVCGGAYALKRWIEVETESKGNDGSSSRESRRALAGVKEGEWFRIWQPTITRAVLNGHRSHTPLVAPDPAAAGYHLDGY